MLNKDYREMLEILLDNEVKFLVVGAYAMGAYGYPRATGDIDIYRCRTKDPGVALSPQALAPSRQT